MLSFQSAITVQFAIIVYFYCWKHTAYYIINSDPDHTRWKQQLEKVLKITFASLSRKNDEKENKKLVMT